MAASSHGPQCMLTDACTLQDLTAYKKFKEKAVASAARSLITLFRDIAPYMLEKKDRGRGADLEARPMQYGAGQVRVSVLVFLPYKDRIIYHVRTFKTQQGLAAYSVEQTESVVAFSN